MPPVSPVGRAAELTELVTRWSDVAAGGAPARRIVVVTGAAGVGKTRLVGLALEQFTPRPAAVLSGAARVHSPAPYDWLAAILAGRDGHDLPVPADGLAWLAQTAPPAPGERYAPAALLRLAVRAVRTLIGAGPAVLVVEDLHALDPASLNLVGELSAITDLPALLIVTSRPPDVALFPQLAARTLARLCGAPGAVRQHLAPLSQADVAQLLAQVYPGPALTPSIVETAWQRTGGNPYWLTELLATTAGMGPQALESAPIPDYVRLSAAPTADEAELTAREREVLSCLAAGMSNKQVARSLDISIRTVAVHVSNLLRKTGSASRTEAALWAVRQP